MVTHDPKAAKYARRIVHLDKGTLVEKGGTRRGLTMRRKYFPLVWGGLWRKKARTILTLLSLTAAFLLIGLLQAVNSVDQAARNSSAPTA